MRYRLIPGPGCPQDLCDRLNMALNTSTVRRAFHTARSAYRLRSEKPDVSPCAELTEAIRGSGFSFREAMLLPVRFDLTARP